MDDAIVEALAKAFAIAWEVFEPILPQETDEEIQSLKEDD